MKPAPAPRIHQLIERFNEIGETQMRDLPLYNLRLEVDAVNFQPFEDGWLGVLITPWFMNVVMLPQVKAPLDVAAIGRKVEYTLPAGSHTFVRGGDDVLGRYDALSLHSPMGHFSCHAAARVEAKKRLAALLEPPEPAAGEPAAERENSSRRHFLRGYTHT